MQLNTTKEIWDKLVQSYEGDTKAKSAKLQTYRIQYEILRMPDDERITIFFLRVDEIVNSINKY